MFRLPNNDLPVVAGAPEPNKEVVLGGSSVLGFSGSGSYLAAGASSFLASGSLTPPKLPPWIGLKSMSLFAAPLLKSDPAAGLAAAPPKSDPLLFSIFTPPKEPPVGAVNNFWVPEANRFLLSPLGAAAGAASSFFSGSLEAGAAGAKLNEGLAGALPFAVAGFVAELDREPTS